MLEIQHRENTWKVPAINGYEIERAVSEALKYGERIALIFFITTVPYIDFLLVEICDPADRLYCLSRFTIHEGLYWSSEKEEEFEEKVLKTCYPLHYHSSDIDHIYDYYSSQYPQWHLKRYYTKEMHLLDHIHHCMTRNTIKELIYKANLDELAVRAPKAYETNLLSSSPSEIYDNVPMRILRAINTEYGAELLSKPEYREFLREIGSRYPDIFKEPLNDAQCEYLLRLKKGELTNVEIYRLFMAKRNRLKSIWIRAQYLRFVQSETNREIILERSKELKKLDSFYGDYISGLDMEKLSELLYYLTTMRKNLDRDIRRSNRKRDYDWQERRDGFVVRYPQTVNDFCREAVYMSNCLLAYLEAYIENDTTILFMRKEEDVNKPFITIEIHNRVLTQAIHRFNEKCTESEMRWIREYCQRHSIFCMGMTR